MDIIEIETEYIKLDQFLKYIGLAESGAHAKEIIGQGLVAVNGQVEKRRGKKLRSGDIIKFNSDEYQIK